MPDCRALCMALMSFSKDTNRSISSGVALSGGVVALTSVISTFSRLSLINTIRSLPCRASWRMS